MPLTLIHWRRLECSNCFAATSPSVFGLPWSNTCCLYCSSAGAGYYSQKLMNYFILPGQWMLLLFRLLCRCSDVKLQPSNRPGAAGATTEPIRALQRDSTQLLLHAGTQNLTVKHPYLACHTNQLALSLASTLRNQIVKCGYCCYLQTSAIALRSAL